MTELHPDEQHVFLQCLNKMQKELDLSFERYERLFKTTQELQEKVKFSSSRFYNKDSTYSKDQGLAKEPAALELQKLKQENVLLRKDLNNLEQISDCYAKGMDDMMKHVATYTVRINFFTLEH